MKKIFLSIIIIIFSFINYSQDVVLRDFCNPSYPFEIKTIEFIVLDINYKNNLVAFKHIYEIESRPVSDMDLDNILEPCNCHYTGMEKKPFAGVILGVYDLSTQEYLKTFTIYNATYFDSLCYDYELSKKKLDSAKLFFEDNNLNISQKPTPLLFSENESAECRLRIGKNIFISTSEKIPNDKDYVNATSSKLFANGKLIYEIKQQDDFSMMSGGDVFYISAFLKNNKIVFLNKFHHNSSQGDIETYNFTPIFDLSKL